MSPLYSSPSAPPPSGTTVTLATFSKGVVISLEAADILAEKGISCEVINLRSLRPLDSEAVINSVMKTNHLVTVEAGWPQYGIGAEIVATVMESKLPAPLTNTLTLHSLVGPAFDYLDAPVLRVTGADVPMPYAKTLEQIATPQADNIVRTVCKMLNVDL